MIHKYFLFFVLAGLHVVASSFWLLLPHYGNELLMLISGPSAILLLLRRFDGWQIAHLNKVLVFYFVGSSFVFGSSLLYGKLKSNYHYISIMFACLTVFLWALSGLLALGVAF